MIKMTERELTAHQRRNIIQREILKDELAKARLLKAAPELLARLKTIHTLEHGKTNDCGCSTLELIKKAGGL